MSEVNFFSHSRNVNCRETIEQLVNLGNTTDIMHTVSSN